MTFKFFAFLKQERKKLFIKNDVRLFEFDFFFVKQPGVQLNVNVQVRLGVRMRVSVGAHMYVWVHLRVCVYASDVK